MNIQFYSNDVFMNISAVLFFFVFVMLFIILASSLLSFFKKSKYKKFQPKISVIIPFYNEEKNIANCLNSLFKSNYPRDKLEVICIDDGSTDNTIKVVKELSKKHKIKLIKGDHNGKSDALNLGIKNVSNEFLLSLDADTILSKNFVSEIIRPFSDKNVGATNGIIAVDNPRRMIEFFQNVEYYFNNIVRNSFSKLFGNGIWFFGAAAAYRTKLIKKLGGFKKDNFTEDMDISLRIFEQSYKVLTVQDAKYLTRACYTIKDLFKQRERWFYGGLQCMKKHKILLKKKSVAIKYLFFNQIFWAIFSFSIIPIIIYQVNFWMPVDGSEIFVYLFRWFSFLGPLYVLYKIPVWGLSFINIFGVMSGVVTTILISIALVQFKEKFRIRNFLAIFFYFPYTILLNAILVIAVILQLFSKKTYFIKE